MPMLDPEPDGMSASVTRRRAGPAAAGGRAALPAPRPRGRADAPSPASLAIDGDGRIAGVRGRRRTPPCRSTRAAAPSCPGFVDCHTHLPFAGWRAEEYEMKVTGVPYEEIARGGGGIRASARALAEATDDEVLAQARALARRDARRTAPRPSSARAATGCRVDGRAARAAAGRAARRGGPAADHLHRAARPRGPRRLRRRRLDGRGRGDAARASCRDRASALDIYVESIAFTQRAPAADGRAGRRARARPARARGAVQREPLGAGGARRAGARSVDHLSAPAPGRHRAAGRAPSARPCCCPARSSWATSTRRPRARSPTPARSACWPPTRTRARRRSSRCR